MRRFWNGLTNAGTLLHEILDFDEAVGRGLEFQSKNPETLVIVTGDHGTGGFSFTDANFGAGPDLLLDSGIVYQPGRRSQEGKTDSPGRRNFGPIMVTPKMLPLHC